LVTSGNSAVERTGARLDEFAATLPVGEQAALRALLRRAQGRPAEEVLSPDEREVYDRLRSEPDPEPSGQAVLTVIMKATRLCNLRCTYCHSWRSGPNQKMSFEVLARATHGALRDPSVGSVDFVWHGGEATILPVGFYRKALWLQERLRRPGQTVLNTMQTNGTRMSDEWLAFLREHDIGVGVSLDGPPEIHDIRRLDAAGRPTSARVREGIERLQAAGISRWGVLMVVDEDVCRVGPRRILEYLDEIGVERVALLNVLPENTPAGTPLQGDYLRFPRYVEFLRDIFDVWWNEYRERIVVRELADLSGQVAGGDAQICVFAGECFGVYLTVEPTGEVSACDKYIDDDEYRFGHVLETGLAGAQLSKRLDAVRRENTRAVEGMRDCRWFGVCHGGCPHDRYTGERRLPGYDGRCCGLAPLLDDMAATLSREEVAATRT
jgi:serine-type anaerobic sulfatase-maturating enzyme